MWGLWKNLMWEILERETEMMSGEKENNSNLLSKLKYEIWDNAK